MADPRILTPGSTNPDAQRARKLSELESRIKELERKNARVPIATEALTDPAREGEIAATGTPLTRGLWLYLDGDWRIVASGI